MMSPVIFFSTMLSLIYSLQTFTQGLIITNGGPANSTLFTTLYLYRRAFTDFKMGYAAALAWIVFLIVLVVCLLTLVVFGRRVYYEEEGR
jgi:multiple sugar transport system permease protein